MILSRAQKFQRLADLLARIQRMIESEGGEPARVREELRDVVGLLGVDLEVVRLLDLDTLVDTLAAGDPGKLWGVAEVLYVEGVLALREERAAEAADRLERARLLYGRVGSGLELPGDVPGPEVRLREIASLLG